MQDLTIDLTLDTQIEEQALSLTEQAKAIRVVDPASYARAGEIDKNLRDMEKQITDFFRPIKQSIDQTKRTVLDKEKAELAPIQEARFLVRKGLNDYLNEQERLRREEQARLEAIEREKARKEQEKLLAQAAKAEEKGQTEKAEMLMERAEDVYEKPVHVEAVLSVKTSNCAVGAAKELTVEVVNLKEFICELVRQDSNAFDALFKVGAAPLKAWVKSNGVKKFKGLRIEEKLAARVR